MDPITIAGLALAGGGMLSDFLGGSSAQRQQQRNFARALAEYMKAIKKGKQLFKKERGQLKATLGVADEEFMRPEAALASQARRFSEDFRRAETQGRGAATLAASRSGMSPALLRFLQQQSIGDISREGRRAFADVGGARANVQSQRASTKVGLNAALANSFTNQAQFGLRGAEGLVQNVLGAAQPTSSPLSGGFGSLAAMLMYGGQQRTGNTSTATPGLQHGVSFPPGWFDYTPDPLSMMGPQRA